MNIDNMSLAEINLIENNDMRKLFLECYEEYFAYFYKMGVNQDIIDKYYGDSISEIEKNIYQDIDQGYIQYYSNLSYTKANTSKYCSFCGTKISKGTKYYRYHPFIVKNNSELVVLKKGDIPICKTCSNLIPSTYEELVAIRDNLEISDISTEYNPYSINYDALKDIVGEELSFRTWTKSKKKT